MNKLGLHALVWVGGWSPDDCRIAVESTKEAGYDLIEIPVLDPSSIDVADTAQVLERAGIGATCSLGLSFDADISSDDPAIVARGAKLLDDALAVARDLGSPYLGGVITGALGKYDRMPTARGWEHCAGALRTLAERAAASGITLGIEVVNRYDSNLINTADQALRMIDDIGAPNVVVHLDTYQMNIEETDFRRPVLAAGDRLGYVHISESHRGYLGTGTVDFDTFFATLREIGYSGTIVFESFSAAVVSPQLSTTLGIWREHWTDGMDLARHARAFMRERLTDGMIG
ncbi:MAG: sugar phosphate isomerase/epimerase [Candidatus Limnocylindrales bacterium]